MVEAKIVAARTQRCWRTVHVVPRAARMASASHGRVRMAVMRTANLLSAASAAERKGPVAKQREGEVVFCTNKIDGTQAPQPTSPSPRLRAGPSHLPPRRRGR